MPPKASTSAVPSQTEKDSVRKLARKAATKAAVSNALILPWPSMPQHARSQALAASLDLLEGVKEYRQAQARFNHQSTFSHKSRPKKRKRTDKENESSHEEPPSAKELQTFHSVPLRSGKVIDIPDHRLPYELPDPSSSKSSPHQQRSDPPQPPEILSHILVGINSVQSSLELYIQAARARLSSQPLPRKNPPTQLSRSELTKKRSITKINQLSRKSKNHLFAPLPVSGASFMHLKEAFGGPLIDQRNRRSISLSQPLPGLSASDTYGLTDDQSREEKDKQKKAKAYKLPPSLLNIAMSVLQSANLPAWVGRANELQTFIRKARIKSQLQKQTNHKFKVKQSTQIPASRSLPVSASCQAPKIEAAEQVLQDPIRVILVCRPDVNPKDLLAHLPNTVATVNGLLDKTNNAPIHLVQLHAGAEKMLSEALGIKSAAVVGIKGSAASDKLETLLKIVEHHQPQALRSAHLDGIPKIEELNSRPTTIRIMQTAVPVDSRALRQSRRKEKKDKKESNRRARERRMGRGEVQPLKASAKSHHKRAKHFGRPKTKV